MQPKDAPQQQQQQKTHIHKFIYCSIAHNSKILEIV